MRIKAEQFTAGDIYQFMTDSPRKNYEVMPPWGIIKDKLIRRALYSTGAIAPDFSPVTEIYISKCQSPDSDKGVDLIVFINSDKFIKQEGVPFRINISNINFEKTCRSIMYAWTLYKKNNSKAFIDRLILIDEGVIVPDSVIEGQPVCIGLYEHFYDSVQNIELSFNSYSFHQNSDNTFYFGEEFREYINSSDTDINDAIIGYASCLIPLYVYDIASRNFIEQMLYEATGNVFRYIEENRKEGE